MISSLTSPIATTALALNGATASLACAAMPSGVDTMVTIHRPRPTRIADEYPQALPRRGGNRRRRNAKLTGGASQTPELAATASVPSRAAPGSAKVSGARARSGAGGGAEPGENNL